MIGDTVVFAAGLFTGVGLSLFAPIVWGKLQAIGRKVADRITDPD